MSFHRCLSPGSGLCPLARLLCVFTLLMGLAVPSAWSFGPATDQEGASSDEPAGQVESAVDASEAEANEAAPAASEEPKSYRGPQFIERLRQGGATMIVLGLLSIGGFAFLLERLVNLRRRSIVPEGLAREARDAWKSGDFDGVLKACERKPSTLASILEEFVEYRHLPASELDPLAEEITQRDLRRHLQKAYPLAVIGAIAPLVGLLGTVIGMIESFDVVAVAGSLGDASLLAGGISKALVTTAGGLILAVPMLLFYHFFKSRVTVFAITLEEQVNELMKLWFYRPSESAATEAPKPAERAIPAPAES